MTGPAQPIEWYLARDNKQYGPLSDLELMKLVELRHLKDEDLVWRAGFADWMPAPEAFPQAFEPAAPEASGGALRGQDEPPSGAQPEPFEAEPAPEPQPAAMSAAHTPAAAAQSAPHVAAPAPAPQAQDWQQIAAAYATPETSISAAMARPAAAGSPAASQPAASPNVETLSAYRARLGPRLDGVAPAPQPAGQPGQGEAARPAKRSWIAPADDAAAAPDVNGHAHFAMRPEPRLEIGPDPARAGQARTGPDRYAPRAAAPDSVQAAAAAGRSPSLSAPSLSAQDMRAPYRGPAPRPAPDPRAHATANTPAIPYDDELDEDDAQEERPRRRRLGGLIAVLVLLAAMVGGVWFFFVDPSRLAITIGSVGFGDGPGSGQPVLASKSAKEAVFSAAKPLQAASLANFPESASGIDQMLQAGYLWQVVRTEFPEWYEERLREAARMATEKRSDELITKHLIDSLVVLRRKNADHAFAASLPKLQSVARRFRDSLDVLTKHSQLACYSLISNGEATRGMVALFREPAYSPALQAGLAAVFEAVGDGRRTPSTKLAPRRSDYDFLTRELKVLGWSEEDITRFADADELAKLPPERVCNMVREWFTAHLAVPDKEIQRRLLIESVRPVVAG